MLNARFSSLSLKSVPVIYSVYHGDGPPVMLDGIIYARDEEQIRNSLNISVAIPYQGKS